MQSDNQTANDDGFQSFADFIKSHLWAIIVAVLLLSMNYGIMTSQISTLEVQVIEVKESARVNAQAVQMIEVERSRDIVEIQTVLANILQQHKEYTTEIKEINNRFLQLYQRESQTTNP